MRKRGSLRGPGCTSALVVMAGLLAGSIGCRSTRPKPVDFSDQQIHHSPRDYNEVRKRWTRHQKVARGPEPLIEIWATYKSWDFREAYIERYAQIYSSSDADRRDLRQAQLESARAAYEFHVTAQSGHLHWNDLERKTSAWRVVLIDGGGRELPRPEIQVLKLPPAYEEEFFPDRTPFTRTYLIRFVKPAEGPGSDFVGPRSGSLLLRLSNPLGRAELLWEGK